MNLQKYSKSKDGYTWRCPRKECKSTISVSGQLKFMQGLGLNIGEFLYIIFYAFPRELSLLRISRDTGLTAKTIKKVRYRFWDMINLYYPKKNKLGSNGEIVEIDESKFKRKGNKGRYPMN